MFAFRHRKNSLSVLSMLLSMAALFLYPVNIILESPIVNYTASGGIIGAVLCSCVSLFLGKIAIANYPKSAESRVMAVIGIVCSALMLLILFIIIIIMVLERFGISVIA